MPKKVRVGRSDLKKNIKKCCCCQKGFCGQNWRKIRFAKKKMVKNCENSVFRVIFVK